MTSSDNYCPLPLLATFPFLRESFHGKAHGLNLGWGYEFGGGDLDRADAARGEGLGQGTTLHSQGVVGIRGSLRRLWRHTLFTRPRMGRLGCPVGLWGCSLRSRPLSRFRWLRTTRTRIVGGMHLQPGRLLPYRTRQCGKGGSNAVARTFESQADEC
jgi:hypothetical protein